MNSVATDVTNTTSTNDATVSIKYDDNNVRHKMYLYMFYKLCIKDHITIHNRCYLPSLCKTYVKTKHMDTLTI